MLPGGSPPASAVAAGCAGEVPERLGYGCPPASTAAGGCDLPFSLARDRCDLAEAVPVHCRAAGLDDL